MIKLSNWIKIPFSETMLSVTIGGKPWGGNSISGKQFNGISKNQVGNGITSMSAQERKIIESELKKLDHQIQELTRLRVAYLSQEPSTDAPLGNSSNKVSEKTESELLTYGITKKTFPRGSVREHIFKTAEALSCYSPCWMMTPANVSTFLPRK